MAYKQTLIRIVFFAALILVLDIAQKQAPVLNALNFLPASRLIKLADNPTVYYANQYRLKMPIPSAEVFLSYGAKWEDIEIVQEPELDFYKDAEYIKLIDNARAYQLKGGVKRYLTQKAAGALKIFPEEVIPVNRTEFNAYASGETLDEEEALVLRAEKDAELISQQENQKCVPDESVGGEDGCKVYQAMEAKDSSLCDSIASEEWKAKCYAAVVPGSGDYLINCKKLADVSFKDSCISQVALAKNNSQLCLEVSDASKKQFCESSIKISQKDINACDSLPVGDTNAGKNICFYTYAVVNVDSRACEKISADSTYKKPCDDLLNQQLSMQEKLRPGWLMSVLPQKILSAILGRPARAQLGNLLTMPVGGRFLPGLAFDIFTITVQPPCLLVSVVGPNPGVFNWTAPIIYDYFLLTPLHAGNNMLGLATTIPTICPPNLLMFGSSLTAY